MITDPKLTKLPYEVQVSIGTVSDWLRVCMWCDNRVGNQGVSWDYVGNTCFRFAQESDAVEFSLVWT
jgi:hypothetical protein